MTADLQLLKITTYGQHGTDQIGGDIRVEVPGRWVRFAAYWGTPPGSRIGLWRTRVDTLRGLNLRIGRRYLGPCLTVFVHTRPPTGGSARDDRPAGRRLGARWHRVAKPACGRP